MIFKPGGKLSAPHHLIKISGVIRFANTIDSPALRMAVWVFVCAPLSLEPSENRYPRKFTAFVPWLVNSNHSRCPGRLVKGAPMISVIFTCGVRVTIAWAQTVVEPSQFWRSHAHKMTDSPGLSGKGASPKGLFNPVLSDTW